MGKSLYLECYSGISGDMTVAALLDLGADQKVLEDVLESIPVQGFEIKVSRVTKSGIDACDFDVILDAEIDGHDHDMEYLHGHDHSHTHGAEEHNHSHTHKAEEHNHQYEHSHEAAAKNVAAHGHDHGDEIAAHTHEPHRHHKHRGMNEICQILADTKMTDSARGSDPGKCRSKSPQCSGGGGAFPRSWSCGFHCRYFVRGSLPGQSWNYRGHCTCIM